MRFSPDFLDEIKGRLSVSEVVGRRVKLMKSGREWKGLSPFSSEKTPSFFVNDQKMAWFDFSSGKNGNIFDFVMATEGLSFPETVERLAGEAGLQLPRADPQAEVREKERASLHEVLEAAAAYFEAELAGRNGARARAYLAERGIALPMQRQFRLGFAGGGRFSLRDHLAAKGASAEAMIEAGLLIHGDDIAVPYDRFRDRVMFPITDRSGRVIAFGGRALDKEAQAKYLNSPETPLFHKGGVLYNHFAARKAAHDSGTVIAVEGYVDVIAMTAAGFPHVVAPLGTALTVDQCELLWKMAPEPVLCFDGDKAGRKAAYRAVDTALPLIGPGRSLRFAFLPEGQDPDDLARSGGPAAIAEVLGAVKPLVDVLWTRETEAQPLDTPERRAALERRFTEIVREINDETLRRYYFDDLRGRLAALFGRGQSGASSWQGRGQGRRPQAGQRTFGQGSGRASRFGFSEPPSLLANPPLVGEGLARTAVFRQQRSAILPREAQILLILLNHPELIGRHSEEISDLELGSREIGDLRDRLLTLAGGVAPDAAVVRAGVEAAGLGDICRQLESLVALSSLWCVKTGAAPADAEAVLLQALGLQRRARALHRELKLAELALGTETNDQNFARLREIKAELFGLEGKEAHVEGFGLLSGRQGPAL